MRQRAMWIMAVMAAGWVLTGTARGVTAVMAHGDAPRAGQWETLDVGVEMPAGGGTVGVRDGRGGLMVVRNVAEGSSEPVHVWMPLPFLEATDLTNNEWPVEVTVTPVAGVPQTQQVVVRRPADVGGGGGTFRVAVVEGAEELEKQVAWVAITPRAVVFARVTAEEVLAGPPLVFAGFDAVLLSPALREKLEESRVLDILSSGVRLVVVREGAAPGLARLPWAEVNGSSAWIVPREPLSRPGVAEPALEGASLAVNVEPSWALRLTVLLVAPVGIVVVLMARGLFRHRAWVFGAATLGLAGVAVAAFFVSEQVALPVTRRVEWSEAAVGRAAPNAVVLTVTETVRCVTPVLSQRVVVKEENRAALCPMAPSGRVAFSWGDARLSLGGTADEAANGVSAAVPARTSFTVAGRSVGLTHVGAVEGWWLEEGYIAQAHGGAGGAPAERQLFTDWLSGHPAMADALRTWYALRYQPHHQYLLHSAGEGSAEVTIDDRGLPFDYRNVP